MRHLIDALDAVLPTSIESLLRQVLNILLAGKAPKGLAPFLTGASLTALLKPKAMGWGIRPIAVGEVIRHMAGKGACTLTKNKAADYFAPLQFGVVCPGGTEKIIHHLREVIDTTPQHLVCRVVQSLHTNHMQMSIVEVFICRRLHMNTSMIPVCI